MVRTVIIIKINFGEYCQQQRFPKFISINARLPSYAFNIRGVMLEQINVDIYCYTKHHKHIQLRCHKITSDFYYNSLYSFFLCVT